MKKFKKSTIIILVLIGLVIITFFIIRFSSNEDSWICQNGQWIKHGNPNSDMPVTTCR
jgi:hypothetical protein